MLATFLDNLRILLFGPIARFFYRRRSRRRWSRRYPIQWMTPREILFMDLENYEPEGDVFKLDKAMVNEFADARDKLNDRIRRNFSIMFIISAILITDYFSIDMKFSLFGVEVKKFVFFRELLFLLASGLSAHTLIIQNNVYTLENAMAFIISNKVPVELRHLYGNRYLPGGMYSRYIPTNLPYINISRPNYWISIVPVFIMSGALAAVFIGYYYLLMRILYDIWLHPSVPFWSRGAVIAMAISYTYGLLYVAGTRFKLPYRNYIRVEKRNVMKKFWPAQYEEEFGGEYAEDIADDRWMHGRGYLPKP
ncbi:hypothetical protein [Rhizobium azibense]|uniref:Uncharacterized protein n=1 Tax=Rhizobium azibense TaxID=1136135 RepID=A0A4R3RUH3_9HYPH|nr:hypothetical protein [Rhizobium azibense]TCU38754.1 hypothetical protein EV129_104361 [Rhizobium azibense]